MTDTFGLMSIGQFSSLSRLSVRMLRRYDERGVLTPAQVDESSGYRRYARSQLADAQLLRELRDVGFGVSALAVLLAARGTTAYEQALRVQRDLLRDDLRAAKQRLTSINRLLEQQEGQIMSSIEVRRETLPAMTVATLRGVVPTYSDEGQLWARFIPELESQGIRATGPGGVIENDDSFVESNPDETVFVPVAVGTTAREPLRVFEIPQQDVVVARLVGPYDDGISRAHAQINEVVTREGLTEASADPDGVAGKVFNIYLNDPSQTSPEELLTDVHRPVR